jgi:hypothetical protein
MGALRQNVPHMADKMGARSEDCQGLKRKSHCRSRSGSAWHRALQPRPQAKQACQGALPSWSRILCKKDSAGQTCRLSPLERMHDGHDEGKQELSLTHFFFLLVRLRSDLTCGFHDTFRGSGSALITPAPRDRIAIMEAPWRRPGSLPPLPAWLPQSAACPGPAQAPRAMSQSALAVPCHVYSTRLHRTEAPF